MKRSTDRILTTHTGSIARPVELREMLAARAKGESVDQAAFDKAAHDAVAYVVSEQAKAGIDVVSDGEQSKTGFAQYIRERLSGFEDADFQPRPFSADAETFQQWSGGRSGAPVPVGKNPVGWKDFAAVEKDIQNLKDAASKVEVEEVFMTAVSPGTFVNHNRSSYYANPGKYIEAVSEVMKREYQAILDAGFILQLDCPDLAASRDTFYAELSDDEFCKIAAQNVEALNHVTSSFPEDRFRVHVCWGAGGGPHAHDIELKKIIDIILKARGAALSIVAANGRHAHEWQVWEDTKLPEGKTLIPGVIDSTANIVEHPEAVAERLIRYANLVGRENVMGGADCGFGTGGTGNPAVSPDVVWAKMASLAQGAEIASKKLWGR